MNSSKRISVLPIYTIAGIWLLFTLVHPLYRSDDYVTVILLSVLGFLVMKGIFPSVPLDFSPLPPPPPPPAAKEPAPQNTLSELGMLKRDKLLAFREMHHLCQKLQDDTLNAQLFELDALATKLVAYVAQDQEKLPILRRYLNYFLPTTLRLLNSYGEKDLFAQSGNANREQLLKPLIETMTLILISFRGLLEAMPKEKAPDISSVINAMEEFLSKRMGDQLQVSEQVAFAAPSKP